jgi:hypothetical protein
MVTKDSDLEVEAHGLFRVRERRAMLVTSDT